MTGLVNEPIGASSACLCDGHGRSGHFCRRGGRLLHFELRRTDRNRFAAHLLQKCDHRENLVLRQPDRVLVDVGHPGRILFRQPFMPIVEIDVCLWLRQTFENEFATELGTDTFEVRTAGGFAWTDGMTERTLTFAEEDLLADRRHIGRRFDSRDIELFFGRGQRGHLWNRQRDQREQAKDDRHEPNYPWKLGSDEQQNNDSDADDRKSDQLQLCDFTHWPEPFW